MSRADSDPIKDLFTIDWLQEWKSMMCRKVFNKHEWMYRKVFNNDEDLCIRDVEIFPCSECRYFVEKKGLKVD
jgi:hypothetical protein